MSREKRVTFTQDAAKQIADVVRQSGDTHRRQGAMQGGNNSQAAPHYLSKTTTAWDKGSSQTLTIWSGTPGSEAAASGQTVTAWNKFSKIKADKWVMLARCNGGFYVISAEC
jgi:hypothetical protein